MQHMWERCAAYVGEMCSICGRDVKHMRERCAAYVGEMWSICGRDVQHMWERCGVYVGEMCSICRRDVEYVLAFAAVLPKYIILGKLVGNQVSTSA